MRKIYIAPETELIVFLKEQPLCAGTTKVTVSGNSETGNEGNEGGIETGTGGGVDARQHNNWMWDNLEEE